MSTAIRTNDWIVKCIGPYTILISPLEDAWAASINREGDLVGYLRRPTAAAARNDAAELAAELLREEGAACSTR